MFNLFVCYLEENFNCLSSLLLLDEFFLRYFHKEISLFYNWNSCNENAMLIKAYEIQI